MANPFSLEAEQLQRGWYREREGLCLRRYGRECRKGPRGEDS